MLSPKSSTASPMKPKVLPFASSTDSTLHRPAWRSTRAIEPSPRSPRRPPSRYRGRLRYDLLGPPSSSPSTAQPETAVVTSLEPQLTKVSVPESPSSPSTGNIDNLVSHSTLSSVEVPPAPSGEGAAKCDGAALSSTNLDELRWFQHRWLDKHGRNSKLKATREQLALMRRWFDSLDADGSGEVGLDELEDPLVSVGLAGNRNDVQHLIEEVDLNGTGSVTFDSFLNMLYPERVKRERMRRFPSPLHTPKHRPPERPAGRCGMSPMSKRSSQVKTDTAANPVVRLFEKLGDLAIPFPVLITAYRRRMLLDAHMAENPSTKRVGTSVLKALESSRQENSVADAYDWRRTHFDLQLPSLP